MSQPTDVIIGGFYYPWLAEQIAAHSLNMDQLVQSAYFEGFRKGRDYGLAETQETREPSAQATYTAREGWQKLIKVETEDRPACKDCGSWSSCICDDY